MKTACFVLLCLGTLSFAQDAKFAAGPLPFVANVQHDTTANTSQPVANWVSFKQCDNRWGHIRIGTGTTYTICDVGCAMTDAAMIVASKGLNYNPGTLNTWLINNGGYVGGYGLNWPAIDKLGKTTYRGNQRANEQEICNGLKLGHPIVASVKPAPPFSAHFVLLTGCQGNGNFFVNDPYFNRGTYHMSEIYSEFVYH